MSLPRAGCRCARWTRRLRRESDPTRCPAVHRRTRGGGGAGGGVPAAYVGHHPRRGCGTAAIGEDRRVTQTPPTIPALLQRSAREFGGEAYLVTPTERLTYQEAEQRSADAARWLLQEGVGKGARVGLFFANGVDWVDLVAGGVPDRCTGSAAEHAVRTGGDRQSGPAGRCRTADRPDYACSTSMSPSDWKRRCRS